MLSGYRENMARGTSEQESGQHVEPQKSRFFLARELFVVSVSYLIGFLMIYGVVLVVPYGFFDDLTYTALNLQGNLEPIFRQITDSGRILHAILLMLTFSSITSIDQLMLLRVFALLGFVILSTSLYAFLCVAGLPRLFSFVIPLLMLTMPPFQVFAAWGVTAFFPYAAVLTGLSIWLTDKSQSLQRKQSALFVVLAILLLVCALSVYQPIAMFFWVYAAIQLFCTNNSSRVTWKRFGRYIIVAVAALVLSYVLSVKLIPRLLFGQPNTFERTHLVSSPLEKIAWFVDHQLVDSLNFISINPSGLWAAVSAVTICVGLYLYFEGQVSDRLSKMLLAVVMVPLSFLPSLVVEESWSSYRIKVSLTSLLVLYAMLAIFGLVRKVPLTFRKKTVSVLMTVFVASASFSAMKNLTVEFVAPQYLEYKFLLYQLRQEDVNRASTVYFVRPNWDDRIAPVVRYDEFGMPSSLPEWMPEPLVYLALHEVKPENEKLRVIIAKEGEFNPPSGSVVVDMRKLKRFRINAPVW